MSSRKSSPKCDVDVLLQHGRVVPPIPGSVRARALARARSTSETASAESVGVRWVARNRGSVIAFYAAVAFVVGAAGAAVAFRSHARTESGVAQPTRPQLEPAACATPAAPPLAAQAPPQPSVEPKATRTEAPFAARESYTAELGLLQRAQAAYADHNFATTLLIVSEHSRRFPKGRLAEEREALHVKALIGAGREEEARKAASGFAARFPRSALLPRLNR